MVVNQGRLCVLDRALDRLELLRDLHAGPVSRSFETSTRARHGVLLPRQSNLVPPFALGASGPPITLISGDEDSFALMTVIVSIIIGPVPLFTTFKKT